MKKRLECPYCDGVADLQKQKTALKNQSVNAWYYKCRKCNEEFTTTESDTVTVNQLQDERD